MEQSEPSVRGQILSRKQRCTCSQRQGWTERNKKRKPRSPLSTSFAWISDSATGV